MPGEIEAKMSARSGQGRFKGGGMDKKKGNNNGSDSQRNGLVYAQQLSEMPDYSNPATRETEK